ncbi:MAG TPA: hypothetical protein ENN34_12460 [Deltaproteobacteria bacterium]|nr:hypothetical protein [Deltaproteobacteria bacterium]
MQTFMDEVRACMPFLGEGGSDVWSDVDPASQGAIFSRLFDPERGGNSSLFTHIEILDSHIEMINRFADVWDFDGTYTEDELTLTVDNSVSAVSIPYLRGLFSDLISVEVDREVFLKGPGDLTVHMAFALDEDFLELVQQYEKGAAEAGVFYAVWIDDLLRIWIASVRGDSKVQLMWEGSVEEQRFRITVCSNETGNWEVMGGGSIEAPESRMAFMARNDATNNSLDEYYLTISYEDLLDGVEQEIYDAVTTPPDPDEWGEHAYIAAGNVNCLEFLGIGEYPERIEDLDWF